MVTKADTRPALLMIAGFGDDGSMFSALHGTPLGAAYRLIALDLPGFGAPPLEGPTTLASLADVVAEKSAETKAETVIAHSVASIIASLAATKPDSPLNRILSLEGNLTPEDAYFSGTAANYDDPSSFRAAFLSRLAESADESHILSRYRDVVTRANPLALWQLGQDARRFSKLHVPGQILIASAHVTYLYNPENCPRASLDWLQNHPIDRIILEGASHWPSVDRPEALSDAILSALRPKTTKRKPR
ncbi:alpha/beta fold hydrolase [Ruegeria sp. HKCCD4884]|uniref:alpha/beta fold hydrolase n=1 Tax=Ruegeria sp. HKCCD4884 TaxID=2683022 RepID=UPI0014925EDB|nr:alpha/beta hydrolase [Ruegeria sp. HKCCD4884]NOD93167.1 alpha/beta fold hydrolase [Ruegeria sp. HKCCD4884]